MEGPCARWSVLLAPDRTNLSSPHRLVLRLAWYFGVWAPDAIEVSVYCNVPLLKLLTSKRSGQKLPVSFMPLQKG